MTNYQNKKNNIDEENELQLIIGRNPVIEALKANKLIDTIYINPEAKGSITLICRLANGRQSRPRPCGKCMQMKSKS